ncbi:hypothetical protein DFH08DRAFT_899828 [Mycena albidolilacea]|uniref:Uncharacterized protein n=1 Tax=Mycena albidolilacea TaxID=1033008 RepID=A0AAD7EB57_9AGAR|nr:hypothetical protein DFH08DRAFT_899828 [Mycena albidolilacea]
MPSTTPTPAWSSPISIPVLIVPQTRPPCMPLPTSANRTSTRRSSSHRTCVLQVPVSRNCAPRLGSASPTSTISVSLSATHAAPSPGYTTARHEPHRRPRRATSCRHFTRRYRYLPGSASFRPRHSTPYIADASSNPRALPHDAPQVPSPPLSDDPSYPCLSTCYRYSQVILPPNPSPPPITIQTIPPPYACTPSPWCTPPNKQRAPS